MFVLALIGLLIQSQRCRGFVMKCLHVRKIKLLLTSDPDVATDQPLTITSWEREPSNYSIDIGAQCRIPGEACQGYWRKGREKGSRRDAKMVENDGNMCRYISKEF
jgi:hypothetical protein